MYTLGIKQLNACIAALEIASSYHTLEARKLVRQGMPVLAGLQKACAADANRTLEELKSLAEVSASQ